MLNSALKVARAKLEEYAQRVPSVVREDYFDALDFNGPLASGLVRQWHITAEEVEGDMGSALAFVVFFDRCLSVSSLINDQYATGDRMLPQ